MHNICGFTVCNVGYLPKAIATGRTFLEFSGNSDFIIFLFDTKRKLFDVPDGINIEWVEELNFELYKRNTVIYNVVELTTAYKPYIAQKLLEKYEDVIFTDPDTLYYPGWIDSIKTLLNLNGFVVTPHYTKSKINSGISELKLLKFGFFNLGFFKVDRSCRAILAWWWNRTKDHCYADTVNGLFTDQRWIESAFCRFPEKFIIYQGDDINVSYWNLHERSISKDIEGDFTVNGKKLAMFHWSAFDPKAVNSSRYEDFIDIDSIKVLDDATRDYLERIPSLSFNDVSYGYEQFSDGTYLSDFARRYLANSDLNLSQDIFNKGSDVWLKLKKKSLLSNKKSANSKAATHLSRGQTFMLILIKRLILSTLGSRLDNVMLLFTYLSNAKNYYKE